jgi:hypothetical protein
MIQNSIFPPTLGLKIMKLPPRTLIHEKFSNHTERLPQFP